MLKKVRCFYYFYIDIHSINHIKKIIIYNIYPKQQKIQNRDIKYFKNVFLKMSLKCLLGIFQMSYYARFYACCLALLIIFCEIGQRN